MGTNDRATPRADAGRGGWRRAAAWLLGLALAVGVAGVGERGPQADAQATSPKPSVAWSASLFSSSGNTPKYVVIHTVEGSYQGCIAWFKNPSSMVSAHYVVSKAGHITQMVRDNRSAWHAGNNYFNHHSIGIEHEGYAHRKGSLTQAEYQASAALTRWLCDTYGIPKDRQHIVGHVEVPGATHTDPGPYWDWDLYIRLVRGGAQPRPVANFFAEDQGGRVRMTLVLTNPGTAPATVNFARWPVFDFVITDARGSEVWRWNRNKRFAPYAPPSQTIQPKQSLYFSVIAHYGPNVPPGRYLCKGAAMTSPLLFGQQWINLDPRRVDYRNLASDGRPDVEVARFGPGVAPGADASSGGLIERVRELETGN
ncbi:MAG: N-acetylmuramoyl-L-alanine amidase [Planctomycetes bacterium]|nr:N-acetylmuramoyl-L-alanine amidase [Planctomycetota bacterium]